MHEKVGQYQDRIFCPFDSVETCVFRDKPVGATQQEAARASLHPDHQENEVVQPEIQEKIILKRPAKSVVEGQVELSAGSPVHSTDSRSGFRRQSLGLSVPRSSRPQSGIIEDHGQRPASSRTTTEPRPHPGSEKTELEPVWICVDNFVPDEECETSSDAEMAEDEEDTKELETLMEKMQGLEQQCQVDFSNRSQISCGRGRVTIFPVLTYHFCRYFDIECCRTPSTLISCNAVIVRAP